MGKKIINTFEIFKIELKNYSYLMSQTKLIKESYLIRQVENILND